MKERFVISLREGSQSDRVAEGIIESLEQIENHVKASFDTQQIKENVELSLFYLDNTSGRLHEQAAKYHKKIREEADKRVEWLKETESSIGLGAKGLGLTREKKREPIDSGRFERLI